VQVLKYNQKAKQPNISKKAAKKNIPKLLIIYCPILLSFEIILIFYLNNNNETWEFNNIFVVKLPKTALLNLL
jgi:hypothetical protein